MRLALAGDTMLGRGVAEVLERDPDAVLFAPEVVDAVAACDVFVLNLECCISARGEPVDEPGKPFFFRAPPEAAAVLARLGVDCVTLANNHALDYGPRALLDTLDHLADVGIAWVGAGADAAAARRPVVLERGGLRLRVAGATDHPASYAAADGAPGVAYADLRREGVPGWLLEAARPGSDADATLVTPHWGPNMRDVPVAHVRRCADELAAAGATLVAGHSAHVFQGARPPVLFDLGDFIDDYAVDRRLRNDLGLLWTVELEPEVRRVAALPLVLEYAHTRAATGRELDLVARLLAERCAVVGSEVRLEHGRLVIATA